MVADTNPSDLGIIGLGDLHNGLSRTAPNVKNPLGCGQRNAIFHLKNQSVGGHFYTFFLVVAIPIANMDVASHRVSQEVGELVVHVSNRCGGLDSHGDRIKMRYKFAKVKL